MRVSGSHRLDYAALWAASSSAGEFARRASKLWCEHYVELTGARLDDIVTLDPGNGFNYDFDLAGPLRGAASDRAPRVVGVWGFARTPSGPRDTARMAGHPRRGHDDRGHLIAHASGGEYDINLVPMNRELNRGRSSDGERFRQLERMAASSPGSLFFIRLLYTDGTDRPATLEVGVQQEERLLVDHFDNPPTPRSNVERSALRRAVPIPIDSAVVEETLGHDPRDSLFEQAWRRGLGVLSRRERNVIAGVTGHVAESIAAVLLVELGWQLLWQLTGTGRHGVDLLLLSPDDRIVALEVKGTLVPGRIPRLSHRELRQMSSAWLDKPDNPGMTELGLASAEVYGGVIILNLADHVWRAALTDDFETLQPVNGRRQLHNLSWLDAGTPPDRTDRPG